MIHRKTPPRGGAKGEFPDQGYLLAAEVVGNADPHHVGLEILLQLGLHVHTALADLHQIEIGVPI